MMSEKIDIDIQQIGFVSPSTSPCEMCETEIKKKGPLGRFRKWVGKPFKRHGSQSKVNESEKKKGAFGRFRNWVGKPFKRHGSQDKVDKSSPEVEVVKTTPPQIVMVDATTSTVPQSISPIRDLKAINKELGEQVSKIKEGKDQKKLIWHRLSLEKLTHEQVIVQDHEDRRLSKEMSEELDRVLIEKITLEQKNSFLNEKLFQKMELSAKPKTSIGTQADEAEVLLTQAQEKMAAIEAATEACRAELESLAKEEALLKASISFSDSPSYEAVFVPENMRLLIQAH